MPSPNAIRLAEIFDAAMEEAGLELVPRAGQPAMTLPGAGVPVASPAVTTRPSRPRYDVPPPAAPPVATPSVRTIWAWDGHERPPSAALVPSNGPSGQALGFLPGPDDSPSRWHTPTAPVVEGDLRWYELEVFVPSDSPYRENTWQHFSDWANFGLGSAPLELGIREGRYVLEGGLGHPAGPRSWLMPLPLVVPNQWTRFTIGILFSSDPSRGWVTLGMDGGTVLSKYHPVGGTLYPQQSSTWRVGYATGSRSGGRAIILRGMRVGAPG